MAEPDTLQYIVDLFFDFVSYNISIRQHVVVYNLFLYVMLKYENDRVFHIL